MIVFGDSGREDARERERIEREYERWRAP